ncbi:HCP-like protein [Gonapodya prolifera JEL478]|uniref:HCP-like protein n=1 Tax=Gonapodya prolifera (strain JEL478) TaxID=1344416 RepID=A0A139ALF4_GONPJ|nr:HCP-like protein [Gonapodya prolifera JEL478]|eukprot:KXS17622.1 HCP-like protein [Gonapodya prolifera JEL478]
MDADVSDLSDETRVRPPPTPPPKDAHLLRSLHVAHPHGHHFDLDPYHHQRQHPKHIVPVIPRPPASRSLFHRTTVSDVQSLLLQLSIAVELVAPRLKQGARLWRNIDDLKDAFGGHAAEIATRLTGLGEADVAHTRHVLGVTRSDPADPADHAPAHPVGVYSTKANTPTDLPRPASPTSRHRSRSPSPGHRSPSPHQPSSPSSDTTVVVGHTPTTLDPQTNAAAGASLAAMQRTLERMRGATEAMLSKVNKIQSSSLYVLFTPPAVLQRKLDRLFSDLHTHWTDLLLHLTHLLSLDSSASSRLATRNVGKLAVAQGSPDWECLDDQHADAIAAQGDKYLTGVDGYDLSYTSAYNRYVAAARFGHARAAHQLGAMYERGLGRDVDLAQAGYWYRRAADGGHAPSMFALALLADPDTTPPTTNLSPTIRWLLLAARHRHSPAMVRLGSLLESGRGSPSGVPDPTGAASWYLRAAQAGSARGMACLAAVYYKCDAGAGGEGGDVAEAARWFRRAAELGDADGMNGVGVCYEEGRGVPRDEVAAKYWYARASAAGSGSGTCNLGWLELQEKNYEEAVRLFQLAAAKDSATAHFHLASLYTSGCPTPSGPIIPRNPTTAFHHLRRGAQLDHPESHLRCGDALCRGLGVDPDYDRAFHHYTRAAELSNVDGMVRLAQAWEVGLGCERSPRMAKVWYERAAKMGHVDAGYHLGALFEVGAGMKKNLRKAVALYTEAARRGSQAARNRLSELNDLAFDPEGAEDDLFEEETQTECSEISSTAKERGRKTRRREPGGHGRQSRSGSRRRSGSKTLRIEHDLGPPSPKQDAASFVPHADAESLAFQGNDGPQYEGPKPDTLNDWDDE